MSDDKFLYQKINEELGKRNICELEIDKEIIENLNPEFDLREYQTKAFQLFKAYYENDFDFRENHLSVLFNMATGSGKTLIMAGLILYLYKKGYNNFLFFVNSNNIIEKTKDNFLESCSNKYLFNEKININGKNININEVKNYQGINSEDINICFTTIQKLHGDLHNEKENSITFEDFKNNKIVLIADEAHHGQAGTKNKTLTNKPNWENTIEKILKENNDNILLEFTATIGIENEEIYKKYLNRLLYKYDLKNFVEDKYSKNIEIFKVDGSKKYRMLFSILINQYRQDLANKYGLKYFKPVILFKAVKEIKESNENHEIFRNLIDNLERKQIEEIRDKDKNPLIKKIFEFYNESELTIDNLIKKIKISFAEERCLNVNEKDLERKTVQKNKKERNELVNQQKILNNLESKDNPIRVVFSVQKLNEGWDVLNLFDIVRPNDKKVSKTAKNGSTVSEAQLIGRGARYYPFKLDESQEKYKRKYDLDTGNELRILEELYFHSHDESQYINELKDALVEEGLMDTNIKQKKLILKESFKETELYKTGNIFVNERKKRENYGFKSFENLKYYNQPFKYNIYSGMSEAIEALDENKITEDTQFTTKPIKISEIEAHVIKNALSKIDFFNFRNLKLHYPKINSIKDIITDDKFLNNMIIDFKVNKNDLKNFDNKQIFNAVYNLLIEIKDEILKTAFDYEGTEFEEKMVNEVFHDKTLNINVTDEKFKGCEDFLKDKDWYAFNANYGTDQEKACVEFIYKILNKLNKNFNEIYLLRNELFFKIYSPKNGEAFAPDFVLFMKDSHGNTENYQLFIEPKGGHIEQKDSWKEEFLNEISYNKTIAKYDSNEKYKVIGLPFFNSSKENRFKEAIFEKLAIED